MWTSTASDEDRAGRWEKTSLRSRRFLSTALALGVGLSVGCSAPAAENGPDPAGPRDDRFDLVDHQRWTLVSPEEDPFAPVDELAPCSPEDSHGLEQLGVEDSFFVRTTSCDYLTVRQSSLFDLRAGEKLVVRIWHDQMTAPEETTATVIVRVGSVTALEETLAIPSGSGLLYMSQAVDAPLPQGEPVFFHVRNHGQNEYNLIEVSTGNTSLFDD